MDENERIDNRGYSDFALSVATGMAFRRFFQSATPTYDPEAPVPEKSDLGQYDVFGINIETLYRNMVSAIDGDKSSLKPKNLARALSQEMEVIESLVKTSGVPTKVIFYKRNYLSLMDKYSYFQREGKVRKPRTAIQQINHRLLEKTLLYFNNDSKVLPFKALFNVKAVVLTHQPYDLLSYSHFRSLTLLESRTGNLLTREKWNKKYHKYGSAPITDVPFCECLFWLFGDMLFFSPESPATRTEIMDLGALKKWSTLTSDAVVKQHIVANTRNPVLKDLVSKFKIFQE